MKKCNSCNIEYNTVEKICPLCQNKLEGECDLVYPTLKRKKNNLFLRITLFVSFVLAIFCLFIDYNINKHITWSAYVILGLISNFLISKAIVNSFRRDIANVFLKYGIVLIMLSFIWYFYTRSDIIVNYIIPILCIIEIISSNILAIIYRFKYQEDNVKILLIDILLSTIPGFLELFKLTTVDLFSNLALLIALINIIGLIIFDFRGLRRELQMIFHI